jgi:ferredoxin
VSQGHEDWFTTAHRYTCSSASLVTNSPGNQKPNLWSLESMPNIEATTVSGTQTIEAPEGKKLVLVIEDAGIDILHRCGGNARCTTCRVEVLGGDPGEMGELERNRLAMEAELADNVRLSCQIRVHDDLKVRVVNQASVRGMDAGPRPFDE